MLIATSESAAPSVLPLSLDVADAAVAVTAEKHRGGLRCEGCALDIQCGFCVDPKWIPTLGPVYVTGIHAPVGRNLVLPAHRDAPPTRAAPPTGMPRPHGVPRPHHTGRPAHTAAPQRAAQLGVPHFAPRAQSRGSSVLVLPRAAAGLAVGVWPMPLRGAGEAGPLPLCAADIPQTRHCRHPQVTR